MAVGLKANDFAFGFSFLPVLGKSGLPEGVEASELDGSLAAALSVGAGDSLLVFDPGVLGTRGGIDVLEAAGEADRATGASDNKVEPSRGLLVSDTDALSDRANPSIEAL